MEKALEKVTHQQKVQSYSKQTNKYAKKLSKKHSAADIA